MSPKLRASSTPHCGKSAGMPHSTLGTLLLVGRQVGDMYRGHRRHSVVRARTVRLSVPPKCLQPIKRFTVTEKLFQFLPRSPPHRRHSRAGAECGWRQNCKT